jgi:hypothetical protein
MALRMSPGEIVPFAAAAGSQQLVPLPISRQSQGKNLYLCWAACCSMALSEWGINKQVCEIAEILSPGKNCCLPGSCDKLCPTLQVAPTVFIPSGLAQTNPVQGQIGEPALRDELSSELDAQGNTVIMGNAVALMREDSSNQHMILVVGFDIKSGYEVFDPDPNRDKAYYLTFEQLCQDVEGRTWTWTWTNLRTAPR